MKESQMSLIRKDINAITVNKQLMSIMMIVPLMFSVFLPSMFILIMYFAPDSINGIDKLLSMIPGTVSQEDTYLVLVLLIVNKIMPVFMLMIPIMASSVMAASSFVGEKEKHTLETLLYSPLSIAEIFQAKVMACFTVGMTVTLFSCVVMLLVSGTELFILKKTILIPELTWLFIICLLSPAISIIAISVTVRTSAKSQSVEEAQQKAGFLILPVLLIVISQFSGLMLINTWIVIILGIILAVIAVFMMKGFTARFSYENLLR